MRSLLGTIACIAAFISSPAFAEARTERVFFTSQGERMAGTLYLPEDAGNTVPAPAVVVTGAWMTVKEQMPARYARELADRGFVALTFDFRGWGESGGTRRQFEDPSSKIADIMAAAAYLTTLPGIDAERIAGLGICASSGYMVHAAAVTPALKAVALVAPWLHDRAIVSETYGGSDGVAALIASGDAAEASFKTSGRQAFVPAASLTDRSAVMFGVPYYTEAGRGLIPAWRNEADPAFWRSWLTFDAIQAAPRLTQPFLMIHSNAAAIPQGARKFYASVRAPKDQLWLDDVTQFGFYDGDAPVRASANAVAEHFRNVLGDR
ncbi:alpha/beta hydrolase [Mesorhizobium sp. NPDC059025]|uniref:alpha/beta hydrolase n=1 Tax=unclassified Mesorhizobium TaxID=325217 RepID=UPI00367E68E4